MKKKLTLITSPIRALLPSFKKNLIFVGSWCHIILNEKELNNTKIETLNHPWTNKNIKYNDFIYLTKKYYKYSILLSSTLNKIHKENFSDKYWEQIVGVWLFDFLLAIYERYKIVKKIKNSDKIVAPSLKINNFYVETNSKLSRILYHSDIWSHFIYIFLLKELKRKIIIKEINYKQPKNIFVKKYEKKTKYIIKNFIIKLVSKLTYYFKNKNNIFLINTYLSFLNEIFLQFRLNKNIKINNSNNDSYHFKNSLNKEIRNIPIKKNIKDDQFDKIIKKIIVQNIPLAFIEEYKQIKKNNIFLFWKKQPSKIFTSASNIYDDKFKIWLAEQKENGSTFIYGQHGFQFLNKFNSIDHFLLRTCDKIISWGESYGNKKKFYPLFNVKCIAKKFKLKKGINITIIQQMPSKHTDIIWSGLDFFNYGKYLELQDRFLKKLKKNKYDKVIVRLGSNDRFSSTNNLLQYEKKKWSSIHPTLIYQSRETKIFEALEKSYLTILTSVTQTTLLECISFNIPFVILTLNFKNILTRKAYKDLKLMERNKILFTDPKKMSSFINSNSKKDIFNWWYSKKNQNIIKHLQKNYAKVSSDPIKVFADTLKKV